MELRKNGSWYQVSPWVLMWEDENYYMVAYDAEDKKIKHYRVDKMLRITASEEKRDGRDQFKAFNMAQYSKSLFGMFSGEETRISIEADNSLVGVIIDRFGKDIFLTPIDKDHFRTSIDVALSNQFLGWIMALGEGIKIVAPENAVNRMKAELERLTKQYENGD